MDLILPTPYNCRAKMAIAGNDDTIVAFKELVAGKCTHRDKLVITYVCQIISCQAFV